MEEIAQQPESSNTNKNNRIIAFSFNLDRTMSSMFIFRSRMSAFFRHEVQNNVRSERGSCGLPEPNGMEQLKERFGNGEPSLKRLELSPLLSQMSDTVMGAWKLILSRKG